MNKEISYIILIITFFNLLGCSNQKFDNENDMTSDYYNETLDENSALEVQLLVNAAEFHLEQIRLGQLAQEAGNTVDVRELGKMMELAHKKAFGTLQELARKALISVPSSETTNSQRVYQKLRDLPRVDFDKEYCDNVVNSHKQGIKMLEKASGAFIDNNIKEWATNMISELKTHLASALICQKKLGNN